MAEQLEVNYNLNRSKKLNRRAHKVILRSKIAQERGELCTALQDLKQGFSISSIWQSVSPSGQISGLLANNSIMKFFTDHPYLSLYASKGLLSFMRARRKTTIMKMVLTLVLVKGIYSKYKKPDKSTN